MRLKIGSSLIAVLVSLVFASSAAAATFDARGSVEQVYATGLPAGAQVTLLGPADQVVTSRHANTLGGVLFHEVTPGAGYHLRLDTTNELSDALTVLTKADAPPSTDVYDEQIGDIPSNGYGYMKMRDGVKLAYAVHPPSEILGVLTGALGLPAPELPPIFSSVPGGLLKSPTLIEYSGYGTADPDAPESGISLLANLMGYTVVDVNMRGTGCSGGAYDFFEPLQGLDGYDIIETVARQPWVKHGKVGLLGISFGGISQLFTAQHQPPSLAAITPLSVIDQTQTTLYPGGVLNTGFAYSWGLDRVHDAQPAPDGQPWANDQIAAEGPGSLCKANQALHPEATDLVQKIRDNDHYVPEVADPLSPTTFVDKINVPTLMNCQWTDEQTGGHCPTLASRMTGTNKKFITFTNGTHVDSLMPENLNRLYNFLEIYVAKESPLLKSAIVHLAAPLIYDEVFGISGLTSTPDAINLKPTYKSAKKAFEAQKPIRILYDNGAGSSTPGNPYPGFQRSYDSFPPAGTTGRSWYLGEHGSLTDSQSGTAADGFTWDQDARPMTNFTGDTGTGGLWRALPDYQWGQDPPGTAVAYATDRLASDTTVLGGGAVDVWVRSSAPDVDLQATISEIRPDGKETFVQGGWVSTEHRALDPVKSTELEPVQSLRLEDISPMPADKFVKVTIPLYYQGHVYRSGSRIRVRISAPSNDQPVWSFAEAQPAGQAQIAIGRGANMPSRLLLPVTNDGAAPTGLPFCPGLRGEPCRDYRPLENAPAPLLPDQAVQPASSGHSPKRCKRRKPRAVKRTTGAHKKKTKKKKARCKAKRKRKHKHKQR